VTFSSWAQRPRSRRRFFAEVGSASAVLLTAAACGTGGEVVVTQTTTQGNAAPKVTVPPTGTRTGTASATGSAARVVANPRLGSTDVAPTAAVSITVFNAKITDLTITAAGGAKPKGVLDSSGATWTLAERLKYGETYTITGTATDSAGATTPINGTLTTVSPTSMIRASPAYATDGATVGVGQPIVVQFAGSVANRAAAQKQLKVTTDKGTIEGSWGWLQDEDILGDGVKRSQVHWRPKDFWPANTKVTVEANLYGVDYGNGNWGQSDLTFTFTVSRKLVAYADVNSFHLRVEQDDVQIKDYPVSYGRSDSGRVTRSGIHLVQDKIPPKDGNPVPTYEMCNAAFGYCGTKVTWPVRINNNGEFIHENNRTIAQQGKANVSHGCVNMSSANAQDFYNLCIIGDPVIVSNTGESMTAADFIYDWIYDYNVWKGFSAL
jgi:lipoprotein-anchoring transpeptidase ErfK/SrfK